MKASKAKKKSYFKTILFSMSAVAVIVTVLLTAFLTANYLKSSVSVVEEFNHELLSRTNYTITQMNDNADRLFQVLVSDKDIIAFLYMKEPDGMVPVLASRTLDKQLITLPYVDSVYLYNAALDLFFSSKTGEQVSGGDFSDQEIAKRTIDPEFAASYHGIPLPGWGGSPSGDGKTAKTLSYFLFDQTNASPNAIIINVDPEKLTDSIRSMNRYQNDLNTNFLVMDQDGNVLSSAFAPGLNWPDEIYDQIREALAPDKKRNTFQTIGNTWYYQSFTIENDNGWYLISLVPTRELFKDVITSSLTGAGIMLAVFVFCILLCLLFARRLNRPVTTLARIMKGDRNQPPSPQLQRTEEFRMILSSFETMQTRNSQLDRLRRDINVSGKQELLHGLLSGTQSGSPERTAQKLKDFELSGLLEDTLCMAVLKIDNYEHFLSENNPNEIWLLRFAVVNITEETAASFFECTVFGYDNDKFVLLIDRREETAYKLFQEKVETMLRTVQANVMQYMKISLTAAYSTCFKGLEFLPAVFSNMKELLRLKMTHGHGCILSPYLTDEPDTGVFQFPTQQVEQLASYVNDGKSEPARELYRKLSVKLFRHDYNEIISGTIHLAYSIYTEVLNKYPDLKEEITPLLKECLAKLQNAEISGDIDRLMDSFLSCLCENTADYQNRNSRQSTDIITERVCRIIERDYSNPALCLSSIADEIGLSPNYIGKIFKASAQKSVAQHISDLRLDLVAERLKTTDLSLSQIVESVGIEKNNYFYTQFKKHFGMSLGEYKLKLDQEKPTVL